MALKFDMSRNNMMEALFRQQQMLMNQELGQNIGEGLVGLGRKWDKDWSKQAKAYKQYVAGVQTPNVALPRDQWKVTHWDKRPKSKKSIIKGLQSLYPGGGGEGILDGGILQKIKDFDFKGGAEKGIKGGVLGGLFTALPPQLKMIAAAGYGGHQLLKKHKGDDYLQEAGEKLKNLPDKVKKELEDTYGVAKEAFTGKFNELKKVPKGILQQLMSTKNIIESDIRRGESDKFDRLTPWNDEWARGLIDRRKAKALAKKNIKDKTFMWNGVAYPTKEAQQDAREKQSIADITARREARNKVNLQNRRISPNIQSSYLPQSQTPDELYRRKLGLPALPHPGYGTREYMQSINQNPLDLIDKEGFTIPEDLRKDYMQSISPLTNPNLNINEEDYEPDYIPFSGEGMY